MITQTLYHSLCNELKSTGHAHLLRTWLPDYLSSLCELASQSPEDVVFLMVESLQLVARVCNSPGMMCALTFNPFFF